LRLVRVQIGGFKPIDIPPGKWRELKAEERIKVFDFGKISG
jgi:16S rRNA U516 pseudouridylate synthase RsuA-like enzyme